MLEAFTARAPSFTINPQITPSVLFPSPAAAGRRITAGFSYIQRIGKSANTDVWFPDELKQRLADRTVTHEDFPAEWAAIRQLDLLQEGGNIKIYDLDAAHMTRSMQHLARDMRAGGYRVTVATLGSYDEGAEDELQILDQRLKDRLSKLIHMLYLEEESVRKTGGNRAALDTGTWDYRDALPHIGAGFTASHLFRRNGGAARKQELAQMFFDALSLLPGSHIVHDNAVGLQLPELIGENEWIYLSPGDETLQAFNSLLNDVCAGFGKGTAQHLRGTGDRLTPDADAFYRAAARYTI